MNKINSNGDPLKPSLPLFYAALTCNSKCVRNIQDKRVGLKPDNRHTDSAEYSNQWVSTPKQQLFIKYWLDSDSTSFGNAYQSALRAGFSKNYARIITSRYTDLDWLSEYKRNHIDLQPAHITMQLQEIAIKDTSSSIRISALDKLARIHGMYKRAPVSEEKIQFVNKVPRPIDEE